MLRPLAVLALLALVACNDPQAPRPAERAVGDGFAREHAHDAPDPALADAYEPTADLVTQQAVYARLAENDVVGYLVRPRAAEDGGVPVARPAVLLIHEWWGLNDNIRLMARRLAAEGYTVLAVDLYEGQTAAEPEEAQRLLGQAMQREARLEANLQQAYDFLETQENASRVAVLGWCFGGMWALRTGLLLPRQLDALVMFYGNPVLDADRLATLDMPILGIFAEDDTAVPPSEVGRFEALLAETERNAEIVTYEGVGHAFANPSGQMYDAEAAADAWSRTTAFLREHLRP